MLCFAWLRFAFECVTYFVTAAAGKFDSREMAAGQLPFAGMNMESFLVQVCDVSIQACLLYTSDAADE